MPTARYLNGQVIALIRPSPANAGLIATIEGRKVWLRTGELSALASGHNLEVFQRLGVDLPVQEAEAAPGPSLAPRSTASPRKVARSYQRDALAKARQQKVFGFLMDQGTGKTKTIYDWAAELWAERKIDAMFVVSLKGVHEQWAVTAAPDHLGVPFVTDFWRGKKLNPALYGDPERSMPILTTNIDSLKSDKALKLFQDFIRHHGGRVLMAIDESQSIANPSAVRKKVAKQLGKMCRYRAVATGTPISKSLQDMWSQMDFLDESIIGINYITTFRAQYCIMGGHENKQIIAHKNIEQFQRRIEPYTFRVTKAEVLSELPPKLRDKWVFDLDPVTRRHYDELRKNHLTTVQGEDFTVQHAAVLTIRLIQMACGMLVNEDGSVVELPDARIAQMEGLMRKFEDREKIIVWSHLVPQVLKVTDLLTNAGESVVTVYGDVKAKDRTERLEAFKKPGGPRWLVANPATIGTGTDGLQEVCRTVIYYTNAYKAIERWQSEDRTHRIGMNGDCDYIDVIARNTADVKVLRNLAQKKSFSDFVLKDDVRAAIIDLMKDDDSTDIDWLPESEAIPLVPLNAKEAEFMDMMRSAAGRG